MKIIMIKFESSGCLGNNRREEEERKRKEEEERKAAAKSRVQENDRLVLDVKVQKDQLEMHRRKLKVRAKKDEEAARQFLRNKEKPKALLALRHKKFQDELIKQVDKIIYKSNYFKFQRLNYNTILCF